MTASQSDTPYLDALRAYAARLPGRLHVPGHKGGPGADPGLTEAIGPEALALDIPALTWGIDVGEEPTPFTEAQLNQLQNALLRHCELHQDRVAVLDPRIEDTSPTQVAELRQGLTGKPRGPSDARPSRHPGRDAAQRPLEHDRRADHVRAASDLRGARARP